MAFDKLKMVEDIESKINTHEFKASLKQAAKTNENIYTAEYIKKMAGRMSCTFSDDEIKKIEQLIIDIRDSFKGED